MLKFWYLFTEKLVFDEHNGRIDYSGPENSNGSIKQGIAQMGYRLKAMHTIYEIGDHLWRKNQEFTSGRKLP